MVDRLFEEFGFQAVDLAIGDHVASLRGSAEGKTELVQRLYRHWRDGALRLRSSGGRVLHTKLYLLSNSLGRRALTGSANFTETGWGGRQVNHMVGVDVPTGALPALLTPEDAATLDMCRALFEKIEADYNEHLEICTENVFGGLNDLIQDGIPEARAINIWVGGASGERPSAQVVFSGFAEQINEAVRRSAEASTHLAEAGENAQAAASPTGDPAAKGTAPLTPGDEGPVDVPSSLTLTLPNGHPARPVAEKLLQPFGSFSGGNELRISTSALLDHRHHVVPLMRTRPAHGGEDAQCWIGLRGRPQPRLARAQTAEDVDELLEALQPIEAYLRLTRRGEGGNTRQTEAATIETLLYLFSSPFFHLHWHAEMKRAASLPQRGPRALFLFGDSGNGKSTLLQFGLSLLAGEPLRPVPGRDLKPDPAFAASQTTTVFPLVFDDVPRSRFNRGSSLEQVLKGWWLRPEALKGPVPALVIAANRADIQGWMRSRVRRITFEVRYDPADMEGQRHARQLIGAPSRVFPIFARRYLAAWSELETEQEGLAALEADELALGRQVLRGMWQGAGRPVPEALLPVPFEEQFAPGRVRWRALLSGEGEVRLSRGRGGRLLATFPGWKPATEHESLLPAQLGAKAEGAVVTIPNGRAFLEWIFEGETIPVRYRWLWIRLKH